MKSEDTVEDPLMSFQFYINSKSVFISCYSPSTLFVFIATDAWICISTTLWIFKTKPWHKLFDVIWRHGWRSFDECSIFYKQQKFFHFVLQSIYCFHFYCKRRLNLYFYNAMNLKSKPWHKLFDEIWRRGWRSVDEFSILYKQQECLHFVLQSIYFFHFYCNRRLNLHFYHAMNL